MAVWDMCTVTYQLFKTSSKSVTKSSG